MSVKFGEDFSKIWPVDKPEITVFGEKLLQECREISKPKELKFNELVVNSSEFPIKFPIDSCRILKQPKSLQSVIEKQAASAYPLIHERVLWLYLKFLEHKTEHGNDKEKSLYGNMTLSDFVQRLLTKRCVTFYRRNDTFKLITGEEGFSGFVEIGTEKEKAPLVLENCLSYDEIKLSALLSVSSYTQFLNDGNRKNAGETPRDKSKIEQNGVIIGLIGARLSRRDLMEFQDIVITKSQNTAENGYAQTKPADSNAVVAKNYDYRQMWNKFYDEEGKLFINVKKDGTRYGDSKNKNDIFDNVVMKKRYAISFDMLLLESEARAAEANKKAYIHVVGIGLGVWRATAQQEEIFLETFAERIKQLLPKLKHIAFIHFSWFHLDNCGGIKHGQTFKSNEHPEGGIKIFISKRNPADKLLTPECENTLLVVAYAWDGNALPGNEFWVGLLSSTGDSSSACSTLIAELHNGHINKSKVSGANLHIASQDFGVLHISDYANKLLKDTK